MSRATAATAATAALAWCTACGPSTAEPFAPARALAFLAAQQAPDGSFPSTYYGVLRKGCSLAALAAYAIARTPASLRSRHAATEQRALLFLAAQADPETGCIGLDGAGVDYPNYTSAFYLLALAAQPGARHSAAIASQVAYLRSAQLVEHRGWQPDDVAYGGFAFGGTPVRKPLDAELLSISVTSWCVVALCAAGVRQDDPCLAAARQFVARCQNADGGFAFTTTPAHLRSKAGTDPTPKSYGSATADGVRAQRALGVDPARGLQWLREHGLAHARVPGFATDDRLEPALRLYYLCSVAHALPAAPRHWRTALHAGLASRQQPSGACTGWDAAMKEDDPLVATPLALLAWAASQDH